ncbi:MAG: SLC13 family permease [Cytophagaceae bacterium]
MEIFIVLGLLVLAIIFFATEKLPIDLVTILLIICLISFGILTPDEAFAGFGSDFIVILSSIFVLTGALLDTGVLDKFGAKLIEFTGNNKTFFLISLLLVTGVTSAFINNTSVTALLVGPVLQICRKLKLNSSKVLMPMAFASILGGTCTLIGTSTNIAVSGFISKAGYQPIGIFEILPVGSILFFTGFFYLIFASKFMLKKRDNNIFFENKIKREYLSEVIILPISKLIGEKVKSNELTKHDINIHKVLRLNKEITPDNNTVLEENDILIVECGVDELLKIKETAGIDIKADIYCNVDPKSKELQLAEILITPLSSLIGKTVNEIRFRRNYNSVVLAIHRAGQNANSKISDIRLQTGDMLLIQTTKSNIDTLSGNKDFNILGNFKPNLFKERKGYSTIVLFALAIIIGSSNLAPVSLCFLTAAAFTILFGAVTTERAYHLVDWRLIILIGGMTAFGTAMEKSGASDFLAHNIAHVLRPFGTTAVLFGLVGVVVLLTQPLSNAAAALVVLPVAIETAKELAVNPRSFAIGIMLGASVSLITPFEPSGLLVYGPGKYKFIDFPFIGGPLTIILITLLVLLVPVFWPF